MSTWLETLLVDDWRDAWKWATNWLGIFLTVWGGLSEAMQISILKGFFPDGKAAMVCGVLVMAFRMWSQRIAPPSAPPAA